MGEHIVGDGIMNDNCSNVHIVNELDVPVLAMGLRDVVISASPEGLLVSDKEQSSYIKPFVDKINQQIMFAEKSWGSFRVLDVEEESLTIKVTLNPGHSMNYHSHKNRNEVWVVISGTGRTIVDGMEQKVHAGDVITIDGENTKVYRNGMNITGDEITGSTYFSAPPGETVVEFRVSDFSTPAPDIQASIREVYL